MGKKRVCDPGDPVCDWCDMPVGGTPGRFPASVLEVIDGAGGRGVQYPSMDQAIGWLVAVNTYRMAHPPVSAAPRAPRRKFPARRAGPHCRTGGVARLRGEGRSPPAQRS